MFNVVSLTLLSVFCSMPHGWLHLVFKFLFDISDLWLIYLMITYYHTWSSTWSVFQNLTVRVLPKGVMWISIKVKMCSCFEWSNMYPCIWCLLKNKQTNKQTKKTLSFVQIKSYLCCEDFSREILFKILK